MTSIEWKACLSGDGNAWAAFVDRYAGVIYAAVRRTMGQADGPAGPDDAQDVAQEVFVRLVANDFSALRRFDPARSSLATYLTVIARRVAIDHLRRRRARVPTVALSPAVESELPSPRQPAEPESDGLPLPPGVLSPRQERILRLLLDEQMSVAEVAETLGIEAQTVRSAKHKALTRLRNHLRRQEK